MDTKNKNKILNTKNKKINVKNTTTTLNYYILYTNRIINILTEEKYNIFIRFLAITFLHTPFTINYGIGFKKKQKKTKV